MSAGVYGHQTALEPRGAVPYRGKREASHWPQANLTKSAEQICTIIFHWQTIF